jgi:hypothetical protein
MDRASLQTAEAELWRKLYIGKETMDKPWLMQKAFHQRLHAALSRIERAAPSSMPMQPPTEAVIQGLMAQVSQKEAGKRPVIICEASPFVVQMTDEDMTTFSLYKEKLQSVRPSMDLECWKHWTSVRSAFWRHEEIYFSAAMEDFMPKAAAGGGAAAADLD